MSPSAARVFDRPSERQQRARDVVLQVEQGKGAPVEEVPADALAGIFDCAQHVEADVADMLKK